MMSKPEVSNTMYDILYALGKDAEFLYHAVDTYFKDAETAGGPYLLEIWQTIKEDRLKHLHMLKEALERDSWMMTNLFHFFSLFHHNFHPNKIFHKILDN